MSLSIWLFSAAPRLTRKSLTDWQFNKYEPSQHCQHWHFIQVCNSSHNSESGTQGIQYSSQTACNCNCIWCEASKSVLLGLIFVPAFTYLNEPCGFNVYEMTVSVLYLGRIWKKAIDINPYCAISIPTFCFEQAVLNTSYFEVLQLTSRSYYSLPRVCMWATSP